MKPDWKDAPEWVKYLAMDEDGTWYWYGKEPIAHYNCWAVPNEINSMQADIDTSNWRDTLEQRPE